MSHTLKIHSPEQTDAENRAAPSSARSRTEGRDYTTIAVAEFEADELASVVASPERALSDPTASVVKRGRSALVIRVDLAIGGVETPTAYKRCGSRTPLRRLVRGVRTTAAVRNFRLGHRLLKLGVDTPRPLIAVSPRWHNLLKPSYLATEWIDGALPLDAFARSAAALSVARRRAVLCDAARQLGRLIGTLHKHGYSHRDLKSANLLVRERDARIEAFLVDLDGASRLRWRLETTRLKNLARLHQATAQMTGVTRTLRCRFLQSYLVTLGSGADWKTVWRQLPKLSKIPPAPASQRRAG